MKKLILVIALFVLAFGALALSIASHHATTPPRKATSDTPVVSPTQSNTPTATSPNAAIISAISSQSDDSSLQQGNFVVVSSVEPAPNWLVVTIRPESTQQSDNSKAILRKNKVGPLTLIAGPGTAFSSSILDEFNVPQAVRDMVVVFNDSE